jgi:hypothetical protein
MQAQLICDALTITIWQQKPKAGLIVDSDQGVQYQIHYAFTEQYNYEIEQPANALISWLSKSKYI